MPISSLAGIRDAIKFFVLFFLQVVFLPNLFRDSLIYYVFFLFFLAHFSAMEFDIRYGTQQSITQLTGENSVRLFAYVDWLADFDDDHHHGSMSWLWLSYNDDVK